MDCGLPNTKVAPLDDIADAFGSVDTADVEAFVQTGTGRPAFAVAERIETELGRPAVTATAAGHRQTLDALGLAL